VLVSATLHSQLGSVAQELLDAPVAVGLDLANDAEGKVMLTEAAGAASTFQLPQSLQQLYMEVPVKMRLPALLGTPCLRCQRLLDCLTFHKLSCRRHDELFCSSAALPSCVLDARVALHHILFCQPSARPLILLAAYLATCEGGRHL
jgi:hypothetical protein